MKIESHSKVLQAFSRRQITVALLVTLPVLLYLFIAERASWRPRIFKVHKGAVLGLGFSQDGKSLDSAGSVPSVQFSDARTLQPLRTLPVLEGERFAFSPSLKLVASGEDHSGLADYGGLYTWQTKSRIMLHDATTGKLLSAREQNSSLHVIEFSSNGSFLSTGAASSGPGNAGASYGAWTLWQVQGHMLKGPVLQSFDRVLCIAFSANTEKIVTGLIGGTLKLWSTRSRKLLRTLDAHIGAEEINDALEAAFSPDGKLIASGHADNQVWLWDAATGKPLRVLRGHTKAVGAVAFSPEGTILASGGHDGLIKLWNPHTGQESRMLELQHGPVYSIAFAPDGSTLASGYKDGIIALWRIK